MNRRTNPHSLLRRAVGLMVAALVAMTLMPDGASAEPAWGIVSINAGASSTPTREVTLTLEAPTATSLRIRNEGQSFPVDFEPFTTTRAWTLPAGDGMKTVYVEFRNASGQVFSSHSDSIMLRTSGPVGTVSINGGSPSTSSRDVTLTLNAPGATEMRISNNGGPSTSFEPYATTREWTLLPTGDYPLVVVVFKDAAGNVGQAALDDILVRTPSVAINGGATATSSGTVTLRVDAPGMNQMRIRNEGESFPESFIALSQFSSHSLPAGDGTKTVYAQFSDGLGHLSPVVSAAIDMDTEAPAGTVSINGGAASTPAQDVTLSLDAPGASQLRIRNEGETFPAAFEAMAASRAWTLSAGDGPKTVYVEFTDAAGNVSQVAVDAIDLDAALPAAQAIAIGGGAATTSTTAVTLTVAAADATEMQFSNDGTSYSAYVPYATSAAWTLDPGEGSKTVYVRFRDAAGNVSSVISDTIVLNANPTAVNVTPVSGATGVSSSVVIRVVASEALNDTSVTTKNNVTLKLNGSAVSATVRYVAASRTIEIAPKSSLRRGVYTAEVTSKVTDTTGLGFDGSTAAGVQSLKWQFTV